MFAIPHNREVGIDATSTTGAFTFNNSVTRLFSGLRFDPLAGIDLDHFMPTPAEHFNRERLGLSPEDVARITKIFAPPSAQ